MNMFTMDPNFNPQGAPQGGDVWSRLQQFFSNPEGQRFLLGAGLQMLSDAGPSTRPSSFGQNLARAYGAGEQNRLAYKSEKDYDEDNAWRRVKRQLELGSAMSEADKAAQAEAAKAALEQKLRAGETPSVGDWMAAGYGEKVAEQQFRKPDEQPSSVREYQFAQGQGYTGSYKQYQEDIKRAGSTNINLESPYTKGAPAGFIWKQPGNPTAGVQPIPQGPADPATQANRGNVTQDERQAAFLLQRLEQAKSDIDTALQESPESGKPSILASVAGVLGQTSRNLANPESRQRIEAAQLDALDAALTLATGAAYTREQLINLRQSYFPQIGDSAKTVADKKARYENLIKSAYSRAGRAAVGSPAPGASAAPVSGNDPLGLFSR